MINSIMKKMIEENVIKLAITDKKIRWTCLTRGLLINNNSAKEITG